MAIEIVKSEMHFVLSEWPQCCGECPFCYTTNYICHNERGKELKCKLGYTNKFDTRDFPVDRKIFEGCKMRTDGKVSVENEA